MTRTPLYLAATLLALGVTPLLAQQEDAPAPPAEATPAAQPAEAAGAADAPAESEPADHDHDEAEDGVAELEADEEMVEVQPAQQAVAVQRLVVRGNAQFIGGFDGITRSFSTELASLPELTLGAVVEGVTSGDGAGSYRMDIDAPGLLTVAARAKDGDNDLAIEVYDENGRQLARCDIDFGSQYGAEHLAVPLPEPGSYRVVVAPQSGSGTYPYWVGASWLAFQELEALAPAKPEDATEITPGEPQEGNLAANGNAEQWFTYTAPAEGLLVFSTRADRGDLVIEAYHDGRFDQHVQYADQDRNGSVGSERLVIDLREGQVIFLKVRANSGGGIDFTARAQFVDTSE